MEADWEIEIGGESPVIEAYWPGFVDLRLHPERASQLPEAAALPALARALEVLNAETSPLWTSKCDFWPILDASGFDLDELDAPPGCDAYGVGGYLDLFPRQDHKWVQPATAAADCKHLCTLLRAVPLRCCRIDLIVRQAILDSANLTDGSVRLGVTAYFTACGPTHAEATAAIQAALAKFARVLSAPSTVE
jgi:hypothetical protein